MTVNAIDDVKATAASGPKAVSAADRKAVLDTLNDRLPVILGSDGVITPKDKTAKIEHVANSDPPAFEAKLSVNENALWGGNVTPTFVCRVEPGATAANQKVTEVHIYDPAHKKTTTTDATLSTGENQDMTDKLKQDLKKRLGADTSFPDNIVWKKLADGNYRATGTVEDTVLRNAKAFNTFTCDMTAAGKLVDLTIKR